MTKILEMTFSCCNWDDLSEAEQKALIKVISLVKDIHESPKWWVSWCTDDMAFEIHTPWWITGYDLDDRCSICAAVIAETEEDAKQYIIQCHDNLPEDLNWRFCTEKPKDFNPFTTRFPRAKWMRWI